MTEASRILIVDDEPDIVDLVSYNLAKEGFLTSAAYDGEEALSKVRRERFDLVLLDLMIPKIRGIDLCRIMKASSETSGIPIIMLTAKTEDTDKVLGLEMGADDYISKPFSARELTARIKAVLRRYKDRPESADVIKIGDLSIDKKTYKVQVKETPISLSATEFKLLLYLVERPGRVFSRHQLLDSVWSGESYVEPRTVDVHIRRIRAQIEPDPSSPIYIKTRRGIGYYVERQI